MDSVLIIVVGIVAVVVVVLLAFTPKIKGRMAAAVGFVKEQVGGNDAVELIDDKATGFGSEPALPGPEMRGPGCLGLGPAKLVFALTPEKSLTIARADIVGVSSTTEEGDLGKGMLKVVHRVDGQEVTSSFRLIAATEWVDALRS